MKAIELDTPVRRIRLSGRLEKRFGRWHERAVATTAEAIRSLCQTIPGFERELMEAKDRGNGFAIFVGKYRSIAEDELKNPLGDGVIKIVPMLLGAKSGWVNVIVGVVLIVVGAVIQYYVGPNPVSNYLYGMGISMIVGGVIQLLSPTPKKPKNQDRPENTPSDVFNGGVNTQAQGNPVPLIYGRVKAGSAVISAGIYVEDGLYIPTQGTTPPGYMGSGGGGNYGTQSE